MPKYIYEIIQCPFCDEKRKSTGLHRHIKTHGKDKWDEYINSKPKEKNERIENGFKCVECDFTGKTKQSISSHWWRNHTIEGKNHTSIKLNTSYKEGRCAWNKGLTKETDERVKKSSESVSSTLRQQIKDGTYIPRKMGEKARKKLSEEQSLHNRGGRSKWYDVSGQKVQGTWERNVALKFEELGIEWLKLKTNRDILQYMMDGKIRSYTPDFYLPSYDLYIEIKGHWWGRDKEKMDIVLKTYPDKKILIIDKEKYEKLLQGELVW